MVVQDIDPLMSQALGLNRHPGVILADVMPQARPKRPVWNKAMWYWRSMAGP